MRDEIERHVTEVLAPQGHVMLVTSRPAGIDEARVAGFHRLSLAPLTEAQQEQAIKQRVDQPDKLLAYVRERVPIDTETKLRVTSNPCVSPPFTLAAVPSERTGVALTTTCPTLQVDAEHGALSPKNAI